MRRTGYVRIAGVDEAGRGCLFGPVFAAAVILDPSRPVEGLADSKTLTSERRAELAELIRARAAAWAVASASAAEIDQINILQASRLAMRRAVESLNPPCDYLLVDATTIDWPVPQQALIKGDARVRAIAAASILAKVGRDECIGQLDLQYPGYGLARHKGYPTAEHKEALWRLGPTDLHRRSYAPVLQALQRTL
ncbi:ribonuclease HII [uncultured Paludibaculum sp.]|uniref:ribonuclease HII n=1 Tax=uncultured Paludibaculum sp. TaxID=1765020 RepID=UPI002AAC14EF|nr:ribonuclease HII [uncultured Paludibaculum sp.]